MLGTAEVVSTSPMLCLGSTASRFMRMHLSTTNQIPGLHGNKAAVTSGFYLPRVPGISGLELRAEAIYTDPPSSNPTVQHGFFYLNSRFKSGYTNDGSLIGGWINR